MKDKIVIITTTFNNQYHIYDLILSCAKQTYKNFELVITDDGSTDYTNDMVEELMNHYSWITHLKLPHGERGIARYKAIEKAKTIGYDYLFIIDSDMTLMPELLEEAVGNFKLNKDLGALVIKEIPTSKFRNPMTKIKVFERKVINNANKVDGHSVEAARFWLKDAYELSGGIHHKQISFEEIQPTIRFIEQGGHVGRLSTAGLLHDEKKVTLKNLLQKKLYHFEQMPKTLNTEKNGFLKAFKRWYFFRPVLYQLNNIVLYIRHPLLTTGMMGMYLVLTFIGVFKIGKHFIETRTTQTSTESRNY